MSGSGHLNIHEIEVFQNSVAYNAFLSQPEDEDDEDSDDAQSHHDPFPPTHGW